MSAGLRASIVHSMPRMAFAPKLRPPNTKPRSATIEQLSKPALKPVSYKPHPAKRDLPPHIRLAMPKAAKRYITDVQFRPLPTTFAPGETEKTFKTRASLPTEALTDYHFPYKYYEITLMRGVIGLHAKTKHVVQSLGLHTRFQVVWRLVGPRSAGQILKIKELVTVRLVNEIPVKIKAPTGFSRIGSALPLY